MRLSLIKSAAGAMTALFMFPVVASAQTILSAGDIGFTGVDSDDPDAVGLVLLRSITAGTTFTMTDNALTSGGTLTTNEGNIVFTAASDFAAGSVLRFVNGSVALTTTGFGSAGNFALSTAGDNIFIYQGLSTAPTFIAALSTDSFITTGTPTTNNTYLPSGLSEGFSAVAFGIGGSPNNPDNVVYNGITSGTVNALRTSLFTAANFTRNDTRIDPTTFPSSFSVTGTVVPEANTFALIAPALGVLGVALARRRKLA